MNVFKFDGNSHTDATPRDDVTRQLTAEERLAPSTCGAGRHHDHRSMGKKKGKSKSMDTDGGGDDYSYGEAQRCLGRSEPATYYAHNFASPRTATLCVLSGPSQSAGMKKKRIIKLTTKQLKRKKLKRERGETLLDRRSKKVERDSARLDKKLAAKALW